MNTLILIGVILGILAAVSIFLFILLVVLLFFITTCRNPFRKKTRECSRKKDKSNLKMFSEAVAWAEQHKDKTEEMHMVNDGLNLYGEYINFGFDKCCVILQGRAESLIQCYYFADIYAKNGYNIFVFDSRTQGLSDGMFQTGGIKESDDVILWIKLINEKYKIADFTIHGVCLGGAAAIYTYCKLKKENGGSNGSLIKRIVTDGLYKTYFDLYKGHIKAFNGWPVTPTIYVTFFLIFLLAKVRPFKENPINYMKDIDIPILFIWSTMDQFSSKQNNEELFESCASEHKEICFFSKGRHAHVRASQKKEYDGLIDKFLKKHH